MVNTTARIRVKLKGYDSVVVDKSAKRIIDTAISTEFEGNRTKLVTADHV